MFIVSLGLLYDSNYEDLVKSSPYGVVSARAKQVYTITNTTKFTASRQAIYQPFTSPRLLSIRFNVYKFINRLIYGTRRYQELFPPITKLVNFNNSRSIAKAKESKENISQRDIQVRSNFPINCAVDDLDLMFDGGDQITIFDSAIDDLHHLHPQQYHHHGGHGVGFSNHNSRFEKGGFEEERSTPVFQQQQKTQQAKRQQKQQDQFHLESHQPQRAQKSEQVDLTPANDLPIFDDFLEAHQHRYIINSNNNNNNNGDDFYRNVANEKELNEVNKNTFISFGPRIMFGNQSSTNQQTRIDKSYNDFEDRDKVNEYPFFDDFEHKPSPIKSMKYDQNKGSIRQIASSIEHALISSSVSSTESFLSPLDDEILTRLHRPSPQNSVVVSNGANVSYHFGQDFYQSTYNDDENSEFAFEIESSLPQRDSSLTRPYSHSVSYPHSQSRLQSHVSSVPQAHSNSITGIDHLQFNNFHPRCATLQQHRHDLDSFKLPNNVKFGRQNEEAFVPQRKRKLSSSGLSITSPSIVSSFDSDVPVSPTDTIIKPTLKKLETLGKLKRKLKKNKKVKVEQQEIADGLKHENETTCTDNHAIDDFISEPVVISTTTKTINTTVRKLSYTGKDGKIGYSFECPHCNSHFKVKGYLTRHLKKHSSSKAFHCPFYQDSSPPPPPPEGESHRSSSSAPQAGTKCHPTGGFSRRDTFKTHLKALHFIYPPGTKSTERSHLSGRCAGCFQFFENNTQWLVQHIETGLCQGAVLYKEKLRQSITNGNELKKVKKERDACDEDDLLGSDCDDEFNAELKNLDYDDEEDANDDEDEEGNTMKKVKVKKEPMR